MPTWIFNRSTWIVLALFAVAAGVWWYGEARYDAGYDAHKGEMADAAAEVGKEGVRVAESDLEEVLARRTVELAEARALAERLRNREPEVVEREVIRYLEAGTCERYGPEFLSMWDAIHGTRPDNASP